MSHGTATCDLLCLASHHTHPHCAPCPYWPHLSPGTQGGLSAILGFCFPEKSSLNTVTGQPCPSWGRGPGHRPRLLPSPPSRQVAFGITWLDSKYLQVATSRALWSLLLVGEESKVQPGLVALQTLGHVGRDVVIPEPAGRRHGHSALILSSLPSVLSTDGEAGAPGEELCPRLPAGPPYGNGVPHPIQLLPLPLLP